MRSIVPRHFSASFLNPVPGTQSGRCCTALKSEKFQYRKIAELTPRDEIDKESTGGRGQCKLLCSLVCELDKGIFSFPDLVTVRDAEDDRPSGSKTKRLRVENQE